MEGYLINVLDICIHHYTLLLSFYAFVLNIPEITFVSSQKKLNHGVRNSTLDPENSRPDKHKVVIRGSVFESGVFRRVFIHSPALRNTIRPI